MAIGARRIAITGRIQYCVLPNRPSAAREIERKGQNKRIPHTKWGVTKTKDRQQRGQIVDPGVLLDGRNDAQREMPIPNATNSVISPGER